MLHAACARVAHMSGAAEAFDKVERDLEDTLVLAVDGSSAHLLDHLLTPLGAIPAGCEATSTSECSPYCGSS